MTRIHAPARVPPASERRREEDDDATSGVRNVVRDSEIIVPLPVARERLAPPTHFRSTILLSSIEALRSKNLFDAYRANLDPKSRDEVLSTVAGTWMAMDLGLAHYEACDRLALTQLEIIALGSAAFDTAKASALHFATSLAKNAGATPWTVIAQTRRLWERTHRGGGGVLATKLGPKESTLEIVAWPLARIRYNRIAMRGILQGILQPFCTKVYVTEIGSMRAPDAAGYRLAWA